MTAHQKTKSYQNFWNTQSINKHKATYLTSKDPFHQKATTNSLTMPDYLGMHLKCKESRQRSFLGPKKQQKFAYRRQHIKNWVPGVFVHTNSSFDFCSERHAFKTIFCCRILHFPRKSPQKLRLLTQNKTRRRTSKFYQTKSESLKRTQQMDNTYRTFVPKSTLTFACCVGACKNHV